MDSFFCHSLNLKDLKVSEMIKMNISKADSLYRLQI